MKKKQLIIDESNSGRIVYSNVDMRHQAEEEIFYLKKGDKVYIERADRRKT